MRALSREEFHARVLARDRNKCVICGNTELLVAHHLLERWLWADGGYYIDNGVSLCPDCHLPAERTEITCKELRKAAGIVNVILPDGFDPEYMYDKWGNRILETGIKVSR